MVEYHLERKVNGHPQRRPSIFDGLPFRITPEGDRAYDAEYYFRALSELEKGEFRRIDEIIAAPTHKNVKARSY